MKTLDDDIRDAYAALDRTTPDGYFDALAARIDDAIANGLEVEAMGPEMTGQMSKTSDNASNPPPPGSVETHDENSGLHDIKEMAQSTKKRVSRRVSTQSDAEEALLASASSSSLAAIALPDPDKAEEHFETDEAPVAATGTARADAATPSSDSPGLPIWIYAAGVAAVAAAAVIFFVARGGGDKDKAEVAASDMPAASAPSSEAPMPPPAPPAEPETPSAMADDDSASGDPADLEAAAAGAADDGDEEAAPDPAATASAQEDAPAEPTAKADKPARRTSSRASRSGSSGGSSSSSSSSGGSSSKSTAKKSPKKPKTETKKDDGGKRTLDDLLDEASGGAIANKDLKDSEPKPEEKKPSKTSLTRSDIQNGMRKILGRVSACQEKHGKTGTVMVSVVIQPDGSVSSSKATGSFAGTPTGDCVASAVKKASFPAWDGSRKSFKYPFLLAQ